MSKVINQEEASEKNQPVRPISWLLFFIFFALVFILIVYYFSEIKRDVKLLKKVNVFWLSVAILAQFLTYLFTAMIYRQFLIAYRLQSRPRLWDLLQASVISLFFNQTMPSAGISGNAFFFNFLARLNIRVTQIISLILADLLIYYAATEATIISFLAAGIFIYKIPKVFQGTLIGGLIAYLFFGALITIAGKKKFLELLYKKIQKVKFIKKLTEKVSNKLQHRTKQDVQVLTYLKNNKKTALKAFLLQLMVVAADAFTLYALFIGLGIPVSFFIVLVSLTCSKIICLLPFLPGSLILYESSMSFFFASFGVPLGPAIIVTLLYRLLSFWFPMPIGLLLYRRWLKKAPSPVTTTEASQ